MALAPGVRRGPYAIAAQIGVGGMGEVYRATDTKLKRDVAVKVLPAALAADPERLARFQREADGAPAAVDPGPELARREKCSLRPPDSGGRA